MNFWDTVFGLLAAVVLSTNESAKEAKEKVDEKYEHYYDYSKERYERMSDERLKKEARNLKTGNGGNALQTVARTSAIKDEIAERREKKG